MRIKMLTLQAGPQGVREVGHIYSVSDKEAKQLIDGGYAVDVRRDEEPERAVRVPTSRRGRLVNEPGKSDEESEDKK
jgi:hypothetical protein